MNWQTIGELDCIIEEGSKNKKCVILLHGYGADAKDLYPLKDYLDREGEATWVFPQAPLEAVVGPGMFGKAWFPIDVMELERALMQGTHRDMSDRRPEGIDHAKALVEQLYEELFDKYEEVYIGGFSQGAMMSTDVVISHKKKPKALIIMSGTLLDRKNWQKKAASCNGIQLFMSHGSQDALLNYKLAEDLHALLKSAGMISKFHAFKGGHEIPLPILEHLKGFINGK